MPPRVTLCRYSTRPKQSWELSETEVRQLSELVAKCPQTNYEASASLGPCFAVEPDGDARLADGASFVVSGGLIESIRSGLNRSGCQDVLNWLLDHAPIDEVAREEVRTRTIYRNVSCQTTLPPSGDSKIPPPWEPARWNDDSDRRLWSNCYNYANNLPDNHPRGAPVASPDGEVPPLTQEGWIKAAKDDGLVECTDQVEEHEFDRAKLELSDDKWLVALFVSPDGSDTHWYRLDNTGCWSYKPSNRKARSCDEQGQVIRDPRAADTGAYRFAAFFKTGKGVVLATARAPAPRPS